VTDSETYLAQARALLAAVLENGNPTLGPLASLEMVQALCELAPDSALAPDGPVRDIAHDVGFSIDAARKLLQLAAVEEPDVTVVLRIAAALQCLGNAQLALGT
jgi:hypothetical protein